MTKRKTIKKTAKTRRLAKRKTVKTRTVKARTARKTVKARTVRTNTVFRQPLTALQNGVSSFIGYFK